jgi:hypothetical protein
LYFADHFWQLLQRDVKKRLDDPDIIKRHPFFKGIDWEKIEVKKFPSPIKVSAVLSTDSNGLTHTGTARGHCPKF